MLRAKQLSSLYHLGIIRIYLIWSSFSLNFCEIHKIEFWICQNVHTVLYFHLFFRLRVTFYYHGYMILWLWQILIKSLYTIFIPFCMLNAEFSDYLILETNENMYINTHNIQGQMIPLVALTQWMWSNTKLCLSMILFINYHQVLQIDINIKFASINTALISVLCHLNMHKKIPID